MKVDSTSPLGKTGLDAAIAQMRSRLRRSLDETMVEFSLDPVAGELIVHSLERSPTGQYGKYAGTARLSYGKLSLNEALPYPLLYADHWPALYVRFCQWMRDTYGLVFEENELRIDGTDTALTGSSMMRVTPDPDTGEVRLVATANSARFVAGTSFKLLVVPPNGPRSLRQLIPAGVDGDLASLSYPA